MANVTFLGIGPQKCATTWLHEILADHPQVCLPSGVKELDFFSHRYDYGFQWYDSQFRCTGDYRIKGEVSPSYFHDRAAPGRIADYNPDIKLITALRDPVQRLISNHKHEVRTGRFGGTDLSVENGLRNNPSYIEQGMYATHLERWFSALPRKQFLVMIFDDIAADPQGAAEQIYKFLEIDAGHRPAALRGRPNESYMHRFAWLEQAKRRAYSTTGAAGLRRSWTILGNIGLRRLYRRLNRIASDKVIPEVRPSTVVELRQIFAPEISRLEAMLDRTLDGWK